MPPVDYKFKPDGSIDLEETIITPKNPQLKLPRGQGTKVVLKPDGKIDEKETIIDNSPPDKQTDEPNKTKDACINLAITIGFAIAFGVLLAYYSPALIGLALL